MTINDSRSRGGEPRAFVSSSNDKYVQEPIAVVGMSCRLPGNSNSPVALWEFLEQGGCAHFEAPETRFNLKAHHDGSSKPNTMRPPGGMFLENIDLRDFDAPFFEISRTDAISMDPNQRQLLEVIYEGLENAGISLESLDGAKVGCFVGSYAVDYADIQLRDPEDRPPNIEVGIGRAILSNRISHFLNIKGPSMTIDTACSGSLVGIDVACRYLQTREINGAIVAASNLYLSPEHVMDSGAIGSAHSKTGRCHTFDIKADGYIKAEAVNAVILKRLDDALRDRDPIRAIIRGSATNSDGRTPGIASPSAEAQATATRSAYANANITDFNDTAYLECHGTGTQAGDPMEVRGVSSVFAPSRSADKPLIIGSIKSNIGHAEPAAGISGVLKAILALEKGRIPGNPTFITPNPKIDFQALKVRATRTSIPWPNAPFRRASVNSFGYGGSNAHIILDEPKSYLKSGTDTHVSSFIGEDDDFFADDDTSTSTRPFTLVFSANDETSLKAYCKTITKHLINPNVNVNLRDLSYTLSERRSRHFHRGYVVAQSTEIDDSAFVFGKKSTEAPKIGFVFTGQGAQWSQMGAGIIESYPSAKPFLKRLDNVLQSLPNPPSWSILNELIEPRSSEHLRLPEFSQPLVTALQLVILNILESWGVRPQAVTGHSSGEIAAASAAGFLTPEEAIKIAYYRGKAASDCQEEAKAAVGMLAVGLGSEQVQKYLEGLEDFVQIGCYNSPNSVTLSGHVPKLEEVKARLDKDHHFARLLQVNLAYHSQFMASISDYYENLLVQNCKAPLSGNDVTMFSSVSGHKIDRSCDARYWKDNMSSPVLFDQALEKMVSDQNGTDEKGADFLIEIGPSGALAGPVSQIKKSLPGEGSHIQYCAASSRGSQSVKALFDVAGRLFVSGHSVNLEEVNKNPEDTNIQPSVIVDLPNYIWNHSTKYWHESESSKDWRFRQFPHHDLLGSKVLGTSWLAPSWRKHLRLQDVPWLKDHKMGSDILMPASGFVSMAIEALYQQKQSTDPVPDITAANQFSYRLRNVTFNKALVLEEDSEAKITLTLTPHLGKKDGWYSFKISSLQDGNTIEHSEGLIRLREASTRVASQAELAPLRHATSGKLWYKALITVGYGFGPTFEKQLQVESVAGKRNSRSQVSLQEPPSANTPQSIYAMHPASIDGCFQTVTPSLWAGHRSSINAVLVPAVVDNLVINATNSRPEIGISVTNSKYGGRGRLEESKNYVSGCSVYNSDTGALLLELTGLHYHKLDTGSQSNGHTLNQSIWKPDISFLSQNQVTILSSEDSSSKIDQIVDLIAHKKPALKVMEATFGPTEMTSLWLRDPSESHATPRAAYQQYSFASSDAKALINVREEYESRRNTSFNLVDLTNSDFTPTESDFDLLIVNLTVLPNEVIETIVKNARSLISEGGYVLFVEQFSKSTESDSDDSGLIILNDQGPDLDALQFEATVSSNSFTDTVKIPCESVKSAYLSTATSLEVSDNEVPSPLGNINLVHLSSDHSISTSIKSALQSSGWQVTEHSYPFSDLQPRSTILITDELFAPVLTTVSKGQWQAIKELIAHRSKILWLTQGSQFQVTKPDNALVHGFFRTIRAEDPSLNLTTLGLSSSETTPTTISAINSILRFLQKPTPKTQIESEFVEHDGIVYISRIVPDIPLNKFNEDEVHGAEPVLRSLHDLESVAMLRAERLGTLDALQYSEMSLAEVPIPENNIEVEIYAASLNFKDVAVSMGIVPENEYLLGLEGAGIIKRVGKGAEKFKIGDRVAVLRNGTFANRIQVPKERAHLLPDSLSFEDAATIPLVYLTSIYSLFNVGNLQKGQSVLIHSATGGVGIACIQLAQWAGAEIYVTVGTKEKRNFLAETFNILPTHMFSSRTTKFASEILEATNGKGIDVIINSLVGDLLDESWRICADGGTLVEIGKKDIVDRNYLSMEPFDRNCSFRAVDFSYKQITDTLIASLLTKTFDLVKKGHIKPIHPITIFPFDDIPAAFAYMRSGRHLGKIVISNGDNPTVSVPVRPYNRKLSLRPDVSYLIVGGLKGLCGSLAVHMARNGAKHIIAMSRSGSSDERSQGIILDCNSLGCEVEEAKADVSNFEDVKKAFEKAKVPIGGVIQGAMVLRDAPYEFMTVEQYHATLSNKVQGTWNLHNAALAQKQPLDFFTMLSSISGVIGQKGQANYSAANVFMDAFATFRHTLGLPANSTNLGVIEDVGYVAEQGGMENHFDDRQWTGINETFLRKILDLSIFQQISPINKASGAQLITGLTVPQPDDSELIRDARFGGLFINDFSGASGKVGSDSSRDIQAFFLLQSSGADPTTLLSSAVEIVNKQFTKTLRLDEPVEPAKSLSAYGLDSLSAVEFKNWVRVEFGTELTTLDITNASSLFSLCQKIISKIPPVASA